MGSFSSSCKTTFNTRQENPTSSSGSPFSLNNIFSTRNLFGKYTGRGIGEKLSVLPCIDSKALGADWMSCPCSPDAVCLTFTTGLQSCAGVWLRVISWTQRPSKDISGKTILSRFSSSLGSMYVCCWVRSSKFAVVWGRWSSLLMLHRRNFAGTACAAALSWFQTGPNVTYRTESKFRHTSIW